MLSSWNKQVALALFDVGLRTGDRKQFQLAWELMHLDAILGLGDYKPNPEDDDPPRPWPIGPWAADERWHISPEIATELIRVSGARTSGDPDPAPSKLTPFADRKLQLDAAMSLRDKLQASMKSLEQIITDLER